MPFSLPPESKNYELPKNIDPNQDSDIEEIPAPAKKPKVVFDAVNLYFSSVHYGKDAAGNLRDPVTPFPDISFDSILFNSL